MKTLSENHARLATLPDRATADLFTADLTLLGDEMPAGETFAERCARAAAERAASEPEQAELF